MYGEASSSRPRKNNPVEYFDLAVVRFLSGEQEELLPQSPVDYDDTIIPEESLDDEQSRKGKEPVRNKGKGKEPDRGDDQTAKNETAKGEDSTEPTSGFFRLPYDVRIMIYRNLLRSDEPIAAGMGGGYFGEYEPNAQGHDLQPQFLATCRQIHSECRDMLFDENVFELSVYDLRRNHEFDGRCNPFLSQMQRGRSRNFQFLKRLEITIDHAYNPYELEMAVRTTARVLTQQMSKLEHLSIKAKQDVKMAHYWSNLKARHSLLDGLTMIRNVGKATVEELDPEYAKLLVKKLTTASPLPKMYYDLELFAGAINCAEHALRNAYEAALQDKFEAFVSSRAKVIRAVKEHMKHAELHLFDNDPVQQAKMEKCSEESGCGHCLPPQPGAGRDESGEGGDGDD